MTKEIQINYKKITVIVLFFVLIFFPYQSIRSAIIETSVTIIDPNGTYISVIAIPENRIPNVSEEKVLNRSTRLTIKIYNQGADRTNDDNILIQETTTTSDSGVYAPMYLYTLDPGIYDFTVKGFSHLTRLASSVSVDSPYFSLDFTDSGSSPLYAGDINSDPGDDKINALDISIILNNWGENHLQADLNQDTEVNALDISTLLDNFNREGD